MDKTSSSSVGSQNKKLYKNFTSLLLIVFAAVLFLALLVKIADLIRNNYRQYSNETTDASTLSNGFEGTKSTSKGIDENGKRTKSTSKGIDENGKRTKSTSKGIDKNGAKFTLKGLDNDEAKSTLKRIDKHDGSTSSSPDKNDKTITLKLLNQIDVTCDTSQCSSAAEDLREYIDDSVDPCSDFERFACGKFLERAVIPANRIAINSLVRIREKLDRDIEELLETSYSEGSPSYVKYLKRLYESCMGTDIIERNNLAPVFELLEKLGGWPLLDNVDKDYSHVDLTFLVAELVMYRANPLFSIDLFCIEKGKESLVIEAPRKTFPNLQEGESHEVKINLLKNHILSVAALISPPGNGNRQQRRIRDVDDLIELERKILQIDSPRNEYQYNMMGLMNKVLGSIQIVKVLEMTLNQFNQVIKPKTIVKLCGLFIDELNTILSKTPKRTIINYLIWDLVNRSATALPERIRDPFYNLFSEAGHISPFKNRRDACRHAIIDLFPMPFSALYVYIHFPKPIKNMVEHLFEELIKSLKLVISNVTWISDASKEMIYKRLTEMNRFIGYPEYFDSDDLYEKYFSKSVENLKPENFLRNFIDAGRAHIGIRLDNLDASCDMRNVEMKPESSGMFSILDKNAIVFPAGCLQWPYVAVSMPKYIEYGRLAAIIGHEISHSIDTDGVLYVPKDTYNEIFNDEEHLRMNEISNCFANQYVSLVTKSYGINTDGEKVIDEVLSDHRGLLVAFVAYKEFLERHGKESHLPGFSFTNEQMFFINYGRVRCSLFRTDHVAGRTHPPEKIRILQTIQNSKEFSKTFNCPLGSPMNPPDKCTTE